MNRGWISVHSTTAWTLAGSLLGAACASSEAEPRDATAVASPAPAVSEPEAPPSEAASREAAPGAPAEPAPVDPVATERPVSAPDSPASGAQMTDFFGIGRGDRVADLGGVSGYSLTPVRRVLGPAGVIYVQRRSPPPTDASAASASDDLAKIIWMNTPDEAPLTADATRLNAVTLLLAYHAVVAAGHDRKALNAAVYRALVPGGLYIVADRAAPPGSGLGAARQLNAIEADVVRMEVQAAGFTFVEAADFVSNAPGASERSPGSQYVLKFAKPK